MFDFLIKTFTSFFIAVGILSPIAPLENIVIESNTEINQDGGEAEIIFISENTGSVEAKKTEAEIQAQQQKEQQLQRERDLELSRQLRLEREREIEATKVAVVKKEVTQQAQQNFGIRETAQTFISSDYSRLVEQYNPLLKSWITINESGDLEYIAGIINDRIILVRTVDAFGNAAAYTAPATLPAIRIFYNEMYDTTEKVASDVSYAKKEITSLSRYIESLGGFDASIVGNNETVVQRLRAFVNDGRLNNPTKIANQLQSQKSKLAQYDSSYNSALEVMYAEIIKKSQSTTNTGRTTSLPCWQIQINFRDEWKAINERYAAQGVFYSPNRGIEVASLTSAYKNNSPNCF